MNSERITTRPDFPRPDERTAGSRPPESEEPSEVFERFSLAYEAQAAAVWDALEQQDLKVWIVGADHDAGETVYAGRAYDDPAILIHLEDPTEALAVAAARDAGKLNEYIESGLG